MRVLVTGSTGQVGRELVGQLRSAGFSAIDVKRPEFDLTNPETITSTLERENAAIVVNCAAYTAVDKAETEAESAWAVNAHGPRLVAESCRRSGIPLIHLSTDYVFDGEKGSPYQVDDPVNPANIYGATKLAGEQGVRKALGEHIILRTSWVYSSHGANFVKTMVRLAGEGRPLRVVNDQRGCPTWSRNIAQFIVAACKRFAEESSLPWGTYHFVDGPETTWFEFACGIVKSASEFTGKTAPAVDPVSTADYPTPARRPRYSVLDVSSTSRLSPFQCADWRVNSPEVVREILRRS